MISKKLQIDNDELIKDQQQKYINDPLRIARWRIIFNRPQEEQYKPKTVVNMNLLRQQIRKKQRDFHQQNHQYFRISSTITNSAIDMNKFNNLGGDQRRQSLFNNKHFNNKQNIKQSSVTTNLKLDSQFSGGRLKEKFQIKQIFNKKPYKKQSIEINPHNELNPMYQFFVFDYQSLKISTIRKQIIQIQDQVNTSQLKYSIKKVTHYMNFFDYIYVINKQNLQNSDDVSYPKPIINISKATEDEQLLSEGEQPFDSSQIQIRDLTTEHRVVYCDTDDLGKYLQTLYFSSVKLYMQFRQMRQVEFKSLKIYQKDIEMNADVRHIISSEKIYLIEIMKQIELLLQISKQVHKIQVMRIIHRDLNQKSEQYLRLICGYTKSQVLSNFNIQNPYQKIHQYILNCLIFNREVRKVQKSTLNKFPVLTIWYNIPQIIFGYKKQIIHQTYYQLLLRAQQLNLLIARQQKYQSLKKKKPLLKYQ